MNRGEQETLFRQSSNLRLQQEEAKIVGRHQRHHNLPATMSSSTTTTNSNPKNTIGSNSRGGFFSGRHRHYSHGNIHQINSGASGFNSSNLQLQASYSRSFGEDRPLAQEYCDDLVLSVLKTPLKNTSTSKTQTTASSSSNILSCEYTKLQGSEDELVEDIESAKLSPDLETLKSPFKFLKRFRQSRELRHEPRLHRVPTPRRRKSRGRTKSQTEILGRISNEREGIIIRRKNFKNP